MKIICWDRRATDSIIKSGQKDTEASINEKWPSLCQFNLGGWEKRACAGRSEGCLMHDATLSLLVCYMELTLSKNIHSLHGMLSLKRFLNNVIL